jgi:hypothetical protein
VYFSWDNVVADSIPLLLQYAQKNPGVLNYNTEDELRRALATGVATFADLTTTARDFFAENPPAHVPKLAEAFQKLRDKGFQIVVVNVSQERYDRERNDISCERLSYLKLPWERNEEVFYVTGSQSECTEAVKLFPGLKILCVSPAPDIVFEELETCSIVCENLNQAVEYLTADFDTDDRQWSYAMVGLATFMPKYYLHCRMRGWRQITKPANVTYLHQERGPIYAYDSNWYKVRCSIKDLLADEPGITSVCDKLKLPETMKQAHPDDHHTFLPTTWSLNQLQRVDEGDVLIVKPIGQSRGSGISVVTNTEELETARREARKFNPRGVVCKYIQNPILFRGLKCHFRTFLMVSQDRYGNTTFDLFEKSLIITAGQEYVAADWTNKMIHDSHGPTTADDYFFPDHFPEEERDKVREALESVTWKIAEAIKGKIRRYPESDSAYHVLGPDVIVDTNYQAWILEVNRRPGLGPVRRMTDAHRRFQKQYLAWEFEKGVLPLLPRGNK